MNRFPHIAATAAVSLLAFPAVANAQATVAGTVISNQAQATYTVNGSAQTTASTIASFVVDRKVNFTLITDQAANTQVNLSQTNAVLSFRLTNTTNGTQDFILDADQATLATGILPRHRQFRHEQRPHLRR